MTGDFITADQALHSGLYNQVVPFTNLVTVTDAFAAKLARGPSNGLAVTKKMLNQETLPHLKEILELEANGPGEMHGPSKL